MQRRDTPFGSAARADEFVLKLKDAQVRIHLAHQRDGGGDERGRQVRMLRG